MSLASNTGNIRYNGTGRAYVGAVGGSSMAEIGEMEGMNFSMKISTEKLKSTRNAARATIIEVETEREAEISFGMREMSEENIKMALMGSAINTLNQSASYVDAVTKTWVNDEYIDLGHLDVYRTRISGTITGAITVGATVTGATSSASGKVAYVGSGYLLLVHVTGTPQAGEQVRVDVSNYITATGIETQEDVVLTDSTGATLRVQGTDYSLDPDYGLMRKLSTGAVAALDELSYDYPAVNRKYVNAMSAGSVEKKLVFVADKDDIGPRQRWTFHKVKIALNGDFPLIGEGAQTLQVTGSVLADTTQPSGQEYFTVEMM